MQIRNVSVRCPGDEKICPEDWTRNFDPCAFMKLAIPGLEATDGQWVLLLATTLRQRDEAIRQRDEARREAEALRWKESRRQATFRKTRRGRARAEAARNELKRLKSASSVNGLEREAGRARACEEATRRTRQRPQCATASLASSVARATTLAEGRHGTRGPAASGATARVAVARTCAALAGRGPWGMPLPAASLARETEKRSPGSSRSRFAPASGVVADHGAVRHARAHRSRRRAGTAAQRAA